MTVQFSDTQQAKSVQNSDTMPLQTAIKRRRGRPAKTAPSAKDLEAYYLVELQGMRKNVACKVLGIASRALFTRLENARRLMANDKAARAAFRAGTLTLAPAIIRQLEAKLGEPKTTLGEVTILADKMRLLNDGQIEAKVDLSNSTTADLLQSLKDVFTAMKGIIDAETRHQQAVNSGPIADASQAVDADYRAGATDPPATGDAARENPPSPLGAPDEEHDQSTPQST